MSKTEANIAGVLLFTSVFLAAGASLLNAERLKTLEEKIHLRDSIIIRMQMYVEHRDSMMFDYIDRIQKIEDRAYELRRNQD